MKYQIQSQNLALPSLLRLMQQTGDKRLDICFGPEAEKLPRLSTAIESIYQALDYEAFFEVWLEGFPYCAVNAGARDHILPAQAKRLGEKNKCCLDCRYNSICSGFPAGYFKKYGEEEVLAEKDLPIEIMIEAESRCNFNCSFCFNHLSFAAKDRNIRHLSNVRLRSILDHICQLGIPMVRFTGGEPLLRNDLLELAEYAHDLKLEVRLNTNATLVNDKNAGKIAADFDNILMPIESWSNGREARITGMENALNKKIAAARLLKEKGAKTLRIGTVATPENIENFDRIAELVLALPIDEWEFYRPVPQEKSKIGFQIDKLVKKVSALRRQGQPVIIANALPMCAASDIIALNSAATGAIFDEGHSRLVIDPRGYVKPHYFIDVNIGDPLDLEKAWHNPFLRRLNDLTLLPEECHNCRFISKCCGGSRFSAKLFTGNWWGKDPAANYKNVK